MLAALGQHFLHLVFLAEVALADGLDLQASFGRQAHRVIPQLIPERLSEAWIVEDPHLAPVHIRGHSGGEANFRQGAEDQHPVPSTQHAGDVSLIPFRQQRDVHLPS